MLFRKVGGGGSLGNVVALHEVMFQNMETRMVGSD